MLDYRLTDRGDMYLFPFNMVFYSSVSSVILGFAQGAVDIFIEQMKVRRDTGTGQPSALSPYVKDRLANAVAKIRSSRARLEQMMAQTTPKVERRELIPLEDRMHFMLDSARVGREAEEAVLLLFKAFSARGIYLTNPIQRNPARHPGRGPTTSPRTPTTTPAGWAACCWARSRPALLYSRPQPKA